MNYPTTLEELKELGYHVEKEMSQIASLPWTAYRGKENLGYGHSEIEAWQLCAFDARTIHATSNTNIYEEAQKLAERIHEDGRAYDSLDLIDRRKETAVLISQLMSRLLEERNRFAQLADERHDALSEERRKNDELRKDLSKWDKHVCGKRDEHGWS